MKTNYLLIDFESVQPASLARLVEGDFHVLVFVGAQQMKLPVQLAVDVQHLGERGQYIRVSGKGANALDFHIAYYIGQLAAQNPDACFHVISRDTGFDPLLQHLKSKGIVAFRFAAIEDLSPQKQASPVPAAGPADRLTLILARLRGQKTSKPRTLKTLRGTIDALFRKQLSDDELAQLIEAMVAQKHLTIEGTRINYASLNGEE